PYSHSPSGVALECKDGRIFTGSYAENAAFNPTLPPLQGALNLLSLNGLIATHRAAWRWNVKMAVFSPAAMRKTPPLTLR
ncbi:hypothetical protein V5H41_28630, partial [Salmonella enterica]